MAGQIETNATVTKIKAKNAELTSAAALGKGKLADATSKITELKADLTALAPKIPEVPSIQGELAGLGSLSIGGLATKISGLVTQYGSAIPGLSSLLGTMGLSSFPPTIEVSSIMDQIPNVEVIDGATVTAPAESKVAEEEPAKPVVKEVVEIDYDEISIKLLLSSYSKSLDAMFDSITVTSRQGAAAGKERVETKYVYYYHWWADLGDQVGASPEEMSKFFNVRQKEKADRYTALYTVEDIGMVFKGVKALYISSKAEHPESDNLLDFQTSCTKWWEKKQKNA